MRFAATLVLAVAAVTVSGATFNVSTPRLPPGNLDPNLSRKCFFQPRTVGSNLPLTSSHFPVRRLSQLLHEEPQHLHQTGSWPSLPPRLQPFSLFREGFSSTGCFLAGKEKKRDVVLSLTALCHMSTARGWSRCLRRARIGVLRELRGRLLHLRPFGRDLCRRGRLVVDVVIDPDWDVLQVVEGSFDTRSFFWGGEGGGGRADYHSRCGRFCVHRYLGHLTRLLGLLGTCTYGVLWRRKQEKLWRGFRS